MLWVGLYVIVGVGDDLVVGFYDCGLCILCGVEGLFQQILGVGMQIVGFFVGGVGGFGEQVLCLLQQGLYVGMGGFEFVGLYVWFFCMCYGLIGVVGLIWLFGVRCFYGVVYIRYCSMISISIGIFRSYLSMSLFMIFFFVFGYVGWLWIDLM